MEISELDCYITVFSYPDTHLMIQKSDVNSSLLIKLSKNLVH